MRVTARRTSPSPRILARASNATVPPGAQTRERRIRAGCGAASFHALVLPSRPLRTGLKGEARSEDSTDGGFPYPAGGSRMTEMETVAIFQQLGLPEILLILGVLLLLFGARKLPELARSLGRSTKEFKSGLREEADEE